MGHQSKLSPNGAVSEIPTSRLLSVFADARCAVSDLEWILERIDSGLTRSRVPLDSVREVGCRLGVLSPANRAVVIGGTNGKGSTAVALEAVLVASGLRVGTALSPHLHRVNERIRLDGREASDSQIEASLREVVSFQKGSSLTYFDCLVLASLVLFHRHSLDCIVLEVGLGGRLDATNVVDADVAAITNVSLDHVETLGTDRESIGREKAGVFRAGRPVVIGEPHPPRSVIQRIEALDCPFHLHTRDFSATRAGSNLAIQFTSERGKQSVRVHGAATLDLQSVATAVQAATCVMGEPSRAAIRAGASARLIGRWEKIRALGRRWLLDCAHNANAIERIALRVDEQFADDSVLGLFHCKPQKDAGAMLDSLVRVCEAVHLACIGQGDEQRMCALACRSSKFSVASIEQAVRILIDSSTSNDLILVCGSFELVSRIRRALIVG